MIDVVTKDRAYPVILQTPCGDLPLTVAEARKLAEQLLQAVCVATLKS